VNCRIVTVLSQNAKLGDLAGSLMHRDVSAHCGVPRLCVMMCLHITPEACSHALYSGVRGLGALLYLRPCSRCTTYCAIACSDLASPQTMMLCPRTAVSEHSEPLPPTFAARHRLATLAASFKGSADRAMEAAVQRAIAAVGAQITGLGYTKP